MKTKIFKRKKSWEPFRICPLISTANPANLYPYWAELALVFSRQLLNGSQNIFVFNIFIYMEPLRPKPAHFCPISVVGSVNIYIFKILN